MLVVLVLVVVRVLVLLPLAGALVVPPTALEGSICAPSERRSSRNTARMYLELGVKWGVG